MKCYLKINVRIFLNKVRVKSSLLYCLCITKYILWCMVYLFDVDRVQMDKRFVLVERSFIKHCGIFFFFNHFFKQKVRVLFLKPVTFIRTWSPVGLLEQQTSVAVLAELSSKTDGGDRRYKKRGRALNCVLGIPYLQEHTL